MKKRQISGDDNYVDLKWWQILRQQPGWWLKLISRDWIQKQTNISSYNSLRKEKIFSIIYSTLHFLRGADFVLTKAAGVVYFKNSKHRSLFHKTSLNINILFVNWIYWMNNSYIAQSNDSKWKITPLGLGRRGECSANANWS